MKHESAFPSYPAYKDSGIQWLSKVPTHWDTLPLLSCFQQRVCPNDGGRISRVLSLSYGKIIDRDVESNNGLLPDSFDGYNIVEPNDIVLRLTDLQNDQRSLRTGQVKVRGIITSAYVTIKPFQKVYPAYSSYLLHGLDLLKVFYALGGGVRQSMKFDDLRRLPIALPPLPEQQAIAAFLDRETAKIDTLIEKQECLISLLTEKRQAVISLAVTKGLDSNVPMKDSGVAWLGKVPAHWEMKRLKHIKDKKPNSFVDGPFGSNLKSEHFIDSGDVYVIESNFATQGIISKEELKTISWQHFGTINRSETKPNDIIIAKIGAQFGKCSILPNLDKQCVVSGNSLKFTVNKSLYSVRFIFWLLTVLNTTVGDVAPF